MNVRARENIKAAGCLAAALLVFFRDVIFQGRGFYYGDYWQQHYPWALELSRALKERTLPFWTDKIGCGFPLLAEGQVGALNPLKWFLYGALPVELGYSLGFIILFFAAGWLMHGFIRRCGGSWVAGITAAFVYCYGSAYAGLAWGAASLWVLAWLPWLMDRAEALCVNPGPQNAAKLALVTTLLWLGGFPQIALYAVVFAMGYVALQRPRALGWAATAFFFGTAAGAVQLLPTFELAALSARSLTGIEFALQKSLHPANLATLVQPGLGFIGADFYIGILPLTLAFFAATRLRQHRPARVMLALIIITLLLALGKWNPLYVALIDSLHLYAFRTPSKWILFSSFGLAVLAGYGWDAWWAEGSSRRARTVTALGVLAALIAVYVTVFVVARQFGSVILDWAEQYVRSQVHGRAGHPHSLQTYLERIPDILSVLTERTRPGNYFVTCTAAAGGGLGLWLLAQRFCSSKRILQTFGMALIAADLFLFSFVGSGFLGNRVGRAAVAPDAMTGHMTGTIGTHRTYEFIPDPLDPPRWTANANMVAGYSSVGLYTPLAPAAYQNRVRALGAVDDSTGARADSEATPIRELALLSQLNVRFLISRRPLRETGPWREVVRTADDSALYENAGVWPRAYAVRPASGDRITDGSVEITDARPGFYRIQTDLEEAATLVVSEYGMFSGDGLKSGWRAKVGGKSAILRPHDQCFLSASIPAGKRTVELRYVPVMFYIGVGVSVAAMLLIACGLGIKKKP